MLVRRLGIPELWRQYQNKIFPGPKFSGFFYIHKLLKLLLIEIALYLVARMQKAKAPNLYSENSLVEILASSLACHFQSPHQYRFVLHWKWKFCFLQLRVKGIDTKQGFAFEKTGKELHCTVAVHTCSSKSLVFAANSDFDPLDKIKITKITYCRRALYQWTTKTLLKCQLRHAYRWTSFTDCTRSDIKTI